MFTQEQNEEIRKVINVFDDYIRETPYFIQKMMVMTFI